MFFLLGLPSLENMPAGRYVAALRKHIWPQVKWCWNTERREALVGCGRGEYKTGEREKEEEKRRGRGERESMASLGFVGSQGTKVFSRTCLTSSQTLGLPLPVPFLQNTPKPEVQQCLSCPPFICTPNTETETGWRRRKWWMERMPSKAEELRNILASSYFILFYFSNKY